jgi:hypothetical protein
MSDTVVVAICTALPPTLVAAAALWKVMKVHRELNSRLTQWREETAQATVASNAAAKAEGAKEQQDKGKA